jgi:FPC/CPF motif-containing protein YcgG
MDDFFDRFEVEQKFPIDAWQRILLADFATTLLSEERPFPCIFGVAGYRANRLRFSFADMLDSPKIAPVLTRYLARARDIGANTSLVILTRPGPVRPLESDRTLFWNFLRDLAALDSHPWFADIPEDLDTPGWKFSFAGELIFVVCNTPAHVSRQSRRSTSFMVTFRPRWVFDDILGTEAAAKSAFDKVRRRLIAYDFVPQSPARGRYGDPSTREFAQYFLDEENEPAACPFRALKRREEKAA